MTLEYEMKSKSLTKHAGAKRNRGAQVVTGEGFPERRRVRLMVTEDLVHYLDKSGQTLASKRTSKREARGPVDANLSENLSDDYTAKQLSMSKVREGLR